MKYVICHPANNNRAHGPFGCQGLDRDVPFLNRKLDSGWQSSETIDSQLCIGFGKSLFDITQGRRSIAEKKGDGKKRGRRELQLLSLRISYKCRSH